MSTDTSLNEAAASLGRKGGKSTSAKKIAAARANVARAPRIPARCGEPAHRTGTKYSTKIGTDSSTRIRAGSPAVFVNGSTGENQRCLGPRKTDAEHELAGTVPQWGAGEQASAFAASKPKMPKYLSAEEQTCWKEIVKILAKRGTLTAGDAMELHPLRANAGAASGAAS